MTDHSCPDMKQHYEKTSLSCRILKIMSLIYGAKKIKQMKTKQPQRTAPKCVCRVTYT